MTKSNLFVIMGVSGTGKTTIGQLLSKQLGVPFFDGDDYHPKENIQKMSLGKPLNDHDRHGWLVSLNELLISRKSDGAIIACSALKESYREILAKDLSNLRFIFLEGSFDAIRKRMEGRKGHFMPLELLKSQFETLEVPKEAIVVSILDTPETIIEDILDKL